MRRRLTAILAFTTLMTQSAARADLEAEEGGWAWLGLRAAGREIVAARVLTCVTCGNIAMSGEGDLTVFDWGWAPHKTGSLLNVSMVASGGATWTTTSSGGDVGGGLRIEHGFVDTESFGTYVFVTVRGGYWSPEPNPSMHGGGVAGDVGLRLRFCRYLSASVLYDVRSVWVDGGYASGSLGIAFGVGL